MKGEMSLEEKKSIRMIKFHATYYDFAIRRVALTTED